MASSGESRSDRVVEQPRSTAVSGSDDDRSSHRLPRRVWLFVDCVLFDKASQESDGVARAAAWRRFYRLAESEGRLFRPSRDFPLSRVAVELEVLCSGCSTRRYGDGVSVSEFVCGSASSSAPSSDEQSRPFVLSLNRDLFEMATGFGGIELESSWCRLWCLAEARGMLAGADSVLVSL